MLEADLGPSSSVLLRSTFFQWYFISRWYLKTMPLTTQSPPAFSFPSLAYSPRISTFSTGLFSASWAPPKTSSLQLQLSAAGSAFFIVSLKVCQLDLVCKSAIVATVLVTEKLKKRKQTSQTELLREQQVSLNFSNTYMHTKKQFPVLEKGILKLFKKTTKGNLVYYITKNELLHIQIRKYACQEIWSDILKMLTGKITIN